MAEKRNVLIISILVVLLVLAIVYIGILQFSKARAVRDNTVYGEGVQYGYQQAIVQIANQAVSCQQVPLKVENQTMNLVWTECLKQASSSTTTK